MTNELIGYDVIKSKTVAPYDDGTKLCSYIYIQICNRYIYCILYRLYIIYRLYINKYIHIYYSVAQILLDDVASVTIVMLRKVFLKL